MDLVVSGLAGVADELEAANHLADGEEAQALSGDDATSDELGGADVADGLEEGLGRLEEAAGADRVEEVLVGGLESGHGARRRNVSGRCRLVRWDGLDVRRGHLLAVEDELADLEADLTVVDDTGSLGCTEEVC